MPSDLNRFLFDYENSKFIECNSEAVQENLKASKYSYVQNETYNNMIKPRLRYMADVFESAYKHYLLTGLTLLGITLRKVY